MNEATTNGAHFSWSFFSISSTPSSPTSARTSAAASTTTAAATAVTVLGRRFQIQDLSLKQFFIRIFFSRIICVQKLGYLTNLKFRQN